MEPGGGAPRPSVRWVFSPMNEHALTRVGPGQTALNDWPSPSHLWVLEQRATRAAVDYGPESH